MWTGHLFLHRCLRWLCYSLSLRLLHPFSPLSLYLGHCIIYSALTFTLFHTPRAVGLHLRRRIVDSTLTLSVIYASRLA